MRVLGAVLLGVAALGAVGCGGAESGAPTESVLVEPGIDGPLGKADSASPEVELKITLRPDQVGLAKQKFGLRDSVASERDIWFYDGAELELFEAGVILRGRSKAGDDDDSTVKLRPMQPADVADEWFGLDGFKCEVDRTLDKSVSSCSLTVEQEEGELEAIATGEREVDKAFSSEQEALLAEYSQVAVGWNALVPLGPVAAQVWKVTPKTLGRKLTFELWTLPDASRVVEVSLRGAPETADVRLEELTKYLASRGFDTSEQQETKTRWALEHFAGELQN